LFGADGRVLSAAAGQQVLARYHQGDPAWVPVERLGSVHPCPDSLSEHLQLITSQVDVARIRSAGFHVLLDSNHGSGGRLGLRLLEQLGCTIVAIGESPDGWFEHPPEPIAENLDGVCQVVRQAGVAVGFCQDPDADRLALIDAQGTYLGEEYTFALCLEHVLATRPAGPVVTNCATSRMAQDIARRYQVPFHRTPVGEAHVADRMLEVGAVFGGEGNGGPMDPRVGYVRDSFVGMALVLDAMARTGRSLAQLAAALPRYSIIKDKIELDRPVAQVLQELARQLDDAQADWQDGLRLDWSDRWLLVRASNTEPLVRVIAEAPEEKGARELCQLARRIIETRPGSE
jgi:phosphomannomutase